MASIVLIETNGTVKTLKAKEITEETLYKKCGFRVNDDFLCRHTWRVEMKETYHISLWAKQTGKANFENKYDFPPPMDKTLFFGTCALVRTSASVAASVAGTSVAGTSVAAQAAVAPSFLDLTKETWLKIYEQLFGGFEDLGDEDEYSEDELANVDPSLLTANGYLKDDFVVSDKEAITSGSVSEGSLSESLSDTLSDTLSDSVPDKKKKIVKKGPNARAGKASGAGKASTEVKSISKGRDKAMALEPEEISLKTLAKKAIVKKAKGKPKTKEPVVKEEHSDSDGTTSELEEEQYAFSDDD